MVASFLGIGSGRCGTQSLSRILGQVRNARVTHESERYRSDAWGEIPPEAVEGFAAGARSSTGLFGDVAFYHLPVVEKFLGAVSGLRIVAMIRDQHEVARSFLARTKGAHRLGPSREGWNRLFPHIEAPTPEEAWLEYWERYYQRVRSIKADIHWVRTEQLNDDEALSDLYGFLGVPVEDRVYPGDRRFNEGRRKRENRWRTR